MLIPVRHIRVMAANNPLLGEHAVASLGWAIADWHGLSAISRVNESELPNLELTEVDMDQRGDEPSYTLMARYTVNTVYPGDWFTTDRGPDYEPVRVARGYARPYNHSFHGRAAAHSRAGRQRTATAPSQRAPPRDAAVHAAHSRPRRRRDGHSAILDRATARGRGVRSLQPP